MADYRHPTYDLRRFQQLVRCGQLTIVGSALSELILLDMDVDGVRDCLLRLQPNDFYKSMPSIRMPGMWQDVYRPVHKAAQLYVKLQIGVMGTAVLIQFKRK